MTDQTTPEDFLREFVLDISSIDQIVPKSDLDKKIKGYAKLLKLREDAARVDELDYWFADYTHREMLKDTVSVSTRRIINRRAELTVPKQGKDT